jgi:tRNA nucleotidyltransferase (CCA-adding enzyme)
VVCSLRQLAESEPVQTLLRALNKESNIYRETEEKTRLYLVGGSVRNAFYKSQAYCRDFGNETDLDLATNIKPNEVVARLRLAGLKVIETGIQHGTVLVVIDGIHLEITSFRKPSDRTTQSCADDIDTDLSGRDFTINALAFSLTDYDLVDNCGGINDIRLSIVRTVGDPSARFNEDPLRILRMIRFGPAQGRSIDEATFEAAKRLVNRLTDISVERIRTEMDHILISPCPAAAIIAIRDIGALDYTIPELIPAIGFEQNRYHIHDVFDHTMAVLDRTPEDRLLRWTAIFHDIGKPHTLSIDKNGDRHFYLHELVSTDLSWKRMEQLKFSLNDMKRISSIVRHHMRPLNCGPSGIRRLIRDLGDELPLWRAFKDADHSPTIDCNLNSQMGSKFDDLLKAELSRMSSPSYAKLAVNGEDLKALGIKPGPLMGQILKRLQDEIIEDPAKNNAASLRTRASELAQVRIEQSKKKI